MNSNEPINEFSIEKALRIFPTNEQVNKHNEAVLQHFRDKKTQMFKIKAQDMLVDSTRNTDNVNMEKITPTSTKQLVYLPL
jgi:hypothetical protein